MYRSYYAEMGGAGTAPDIPARSERCRADTGNVTAFRRPAQPKPKAASRITDRQPSRGFRWR